MQVVIKFGTNWNLLFVLKFTQFLYVLPKNQLSRMGYNIKNSVKLFEIGFDIQKTCFLKPALVVIFLTFWLTYIRCINWFALVKG